MYDLDGELRRVLESLSGLSSLEPAVSRGWSDARLTQMTASSGGAFLGQKRRPDRNTK